MRDLPLFLACLTLMAGIAFLAYAAITRRARNRGRT